MRTKKIQTEVDPTTNSTNPKTVVAMVFTKPQIALLELDLGRQDLNQVVAKLNEAITRING